MKIEEAKEAIKASSKAMTDINAIHSFGHIPCKQAIPVNDAIKILDQLDQPKLEVPQCVFDLIKKYKNENRSFYAFIENTSDVKEVWEWLNMPKPGIKESELMQAWLAYPNITVEKEKLYTVEIPNPNLNTHTILQKIGKGLALIMVTNARWKGWESSKLTEAEIKKDFDWAFRWAKEVTK